MDSTKRQWTRASYQACLRLAEASDSKQEDRFLRADAAQLLKDLQAGCPHEETVTLYSYYSGSYTNDYDDKKPGHRRCMCCGLEEYTWDDAFKTLTTAIARFEGKYPEQVSKPLSYLLSEVVEVALREGYRP